MSKVDVVFTGESKFPQSTANIETDAGVTDYTYYGQQMHNPNGPIYLVDGQMTGSNATTLDGHVLVSVNDPNAFSKANVRMTHHLPQAQPINVLGGNRLRVDHSISLNDSRVLQRNPSGQQPNEQFTQIVGLQGMASIVQLMPG